VYPAFRSRQRFALQRARPIRLEAGEAPPLGQSPRDQHRRLAPRRELQVVGSLHIMPRIEYWHRGRMLLVGDSAQAPCNSSGQGASLAIESAVEVARCLPDLPDIPSAFAAYESLRSARVEKVAARAARINSAKAPETIAEVLIPLMMPILMKTVMNPEKTVGPSNAT
jgi:2-polyprenyl-6-methoxyphenol hydroxylase-like FAD-dependent oxidoreductase